MKANLHKKFEDKNIFSVKWNEFRLGHRRLISVQCRRNNRAVNPHKVQEESLKNLEGKKYSGLLTEYAIMGIKRAFEKMMVLCEPFWAYDYETKKKRKARMIAWLFTIPEGYGELEGTTMNELMSRVLDNLRHKYPITLYLGKHEFTQANMPHCHLNVNAFMSYQYVHRAWVKVIKDQPCYVKWLEHHPGHNPNCSQYDPENKDNLVGYRPLWTSSDCKEYLYCYLKKMSQNKIPTDGKVWFQSNTLRDSKLPLLSYNIRQKELLKEGEGKKNIKSFTVNWVHYKVDSDGAVNDEVHHKNNLTKVWQSVGKSDIIDYLTQANRYRLKQCRWAAKHGKIPVYDVELYSNFRVRYLDPNPSSGSESQDINDQEIFFSRREYNISED